MSVAQASSERAAAALDHAADMVAARRARAAFEAIGLARSSSAVARAGWPACHAALAAADEAAAARRGVDAQVRRALERRGGRRVPAAQARPLGRALELVGDARRRYRRRRRAVPGALVGVELAVERVGEREVRGAALARRAPW